jgi:hypothetical protein
MMALPAVVGGVGAAAASTVADKISRPFGNKPLMNRIYDLR